MATATGPDPVAADHFWTPRELNAVTVLAPAFAVYTTSSMVPVTS